MTQEQDNAQRRAQLSEARRALLEQWLQGKTNPTPAPQTTIPRRADRERAPLSFAQQRLWLIDQLDPGSPAYNMPGIIHLKGSLDSAALERSLHEIMRRHETLRASFVSVDGVPMQHIAPDGTIQLRQIDLRDLSPDAQRSAVQQQTLADARQPFDLSRSPLLRTTLLQLGAQEHLLLLTLHHIIADGWSIGVFVRELSELYTAFTSGKPSLLPELPVQYTDYADWQHRQLQGETHAQHLAYWKKQLHPEGTRLPVLQLPTDRPRPAFQTFAGGRHSLSLPQSLLEALKALGHSAEATLFMTLLAAWQVLLQRYSGQDDVVVGSVTAGRTKRELESLIGFFVDNLVLRTNLGGNPTFRELLGRVRATCLEAFAHQDVPFVQLVELLQPERDPSRSPLFQVMFVLQTNQTGPIQLPNLLLTVAEGETGTTKFDLLLNLEERANGLQGWIEYNTDLFAPATIERLARHLQTLLEGIVAEPDQRIAYLPLLSAAEHHRMLVEWNDAAAEYPRESCVHALFAAQAAQTPHAPAITFEDQALSYAELDRHANQLAHHLRARGVGPDVLVALCVERSLELIVGILGILKAGGAYVPLDPNYPQARLRFMFEDTGAPVLVAQQQLLTNLPAHAATVVCIDAEWEDITRQPTTDPGVALTPDHLAYVMYTSGSTGTPKGIGVSHRNVARLVKNTNYIQPTPADVFLQLAPSAFDAATFEIWGALLNGAQLVLFPPHIPALDELGAAIERYGITTLWLTAGLFHLMVDYQLPALRGVRYLLAGGDVLSVPHVNRVLAELPHCTLINGYGPTENTTFTCCYLMMHGERIEGSVPIGRPIANTEVYLLDPWMQPVPVGVAGELYAGGDGLARGYLHRPDLTAERFVPNPFDLAPGSRLYRTGDLARYRADGTIEFLGRIDQQVKLRGFRIELGEIEALLVQHSQVKECVVVAREDGPGEQRLVAYLVENKEQAEQQDKEQQNKEQRSTEQGNEAQPGLDVQSLRGVLREQLPDYMIPSAFVIVDRLPRTPSGKVDRGALPAPESQAEGDAAFVAPANPTEALLAQIWSDVLGIERLGTRSNFFELGGHSLLATQIVSRVRDLFQLELPLRVLFANPTVSGLAEWISAAQRTEVGLPPPLRPVSRDRDLPLSFAQQRLWFLNQLQPDSATYAIPTATRLIGRLDVAALHRSFNAIIDRHETLRTTFAQAPAVNGRPVQRIAPSLTIALPLHDLSALPPDARALEVRQQMAHMVAQPFDLAAGPLLRALVLRLGAEEHVLLLNLHHIIADGWSIGVFMHELTVLYAALSAGQEHLDTSPLPPLPIQYADYAVWQREWLQGAVLEQQLAYWRQQLAGAPPVLTLPTDRPRPAVQSFKGALMPLTLPADLSDALRSLSRQQGVTLFMTLLAAFQSLLSHYSGQQDIVVGTPIANRNYSATEQLIGFFVNTLVLRGDLRGRMTFRELLHRTRTATLGAYAHQDLPFEQLVEDLRPARDPSYAPLFQVLFALQNAPLPNVALEGLEMQRIDVESGTVKYDLILSLDDHDTALTGWIEYSTDLFDATTIVRMQEHFGVLLRAIVAEPDRRLDELSLLTDAERQRMLHDWNATDIAYADELCIHHCFEAQAAATPAAVALVYNEQSLTYAELNARANQLAHFLRTRGVDCETRVGLCVERSLELIVGFLGILKAGGAYVPLDPAYPADRLQFMLHDTQAPVLLTQADLAERLADQAVPLVCLDRDLSQIEREAVTNPQVAITPDDLAYIIYTSGSTGRPKGVMIPHRGIVSLKETQIKLMDVGVGSRVLEFASPSFDASVWEFVFALLSGAALYLNDHERLLPGPSLFEVMRDQSITHALLSPSALASMPGEDLPHLAVINAGTEKCSAEVVARWKPGRRFFNAYGPTETTVYSLGFECHTVTPNGPPIGRPVGNTQVYILNPQLQPVPIGVVGEIYIGGVGVSRGYLNRPELTAERFIPDSFSGRHGARLYQTGDLAYYLADGNVVYLGRSDHQVKLRGFRIELGEIESVLAQHPEVRESIVQLRESTAGQQLVAYVLREADHTPNVSALRSFLATKLPEYMIPNTFVVLDTLPLTPNGKLDRQALPLPDSLRPDLSAAYVIPQTEIERQIAEVWQDILHVKNVGLHDNFFDLGGHSLLVVQVHAELKARFNHSISMVDLFKYPTISALAEYLSQADPDQPPAPQPDKQLQTVKAGRSWLKQRAGQSRTEQKD